MAPYVPTLNFFAVDLLHRSWIINSATSALLELPGVSEPQHLPKQAARRILTRAPTGLHPKK